MFNFDYSLIVQLFVLLNPLYSFPYLVYAHDKKLNVRLIAVKAVAVAFVIALIITFAGLTLFNIFGITLDSFRIAGGLILLLLGIDMVRPHEDDHTKIGNVNSLIAIVATPLLTGPATISFITIKAAELGQWHVFWNIVATFLLVAAIFIAFSFLVTRVNVTLVDIISRVMGLFLTAVSIEMIAKGLEGVIRVAVG